VGAAVLAGDGVVLLGVGVLLVVVGFGSAVVVLGAAVVVGAVGVVGTDVTVTVGAAVVGGAFTVNIGGLVVLGVDVSSSCHVTWLCSLGVGAAMARVVDTGSGVRSVVQPDSTVAPTRPRARTVLRRAGTGRWWYIVLRAGRRGLGHCRAGRPLPYDKSPSTVATVPFARVLAWSR